MADTTNLTYQSESRALVPVPATDDPDVIRRQIDYTRVQLGTTIQAISERLSPDYLIEQVKTSAREATVGRIKEMTHEANRKVEGASSSLGQVVRENPLPVAVIGLGLGWLLLSERNKRDMVQNGGNGYHTGRQMYYDDMHDDRLMRATRDRVGDIASSVGQSAAQMKNRVGNTLQEAGDTVSDVAGRAGEAVSDTSQRVGDTLSGTAARVGDAVTQTTEMVQDKAGEVSERARIEAEILRREAELRSRRAVQRTKQSFQQTMESSPLALGAVLVIAGAAVGAAIPASEYENRLMGETRDRLLDEAKVHAQDAVGKIQTVVEDTQRAVVSEVKESARRQDIPIDDVMQGTENTY